MAAVLGASPKVIWLAGFPRKVPACPSLPGWQRPLRAGRQVREFEPKCLAAQRWERRSFRMRRKTLLVPLAADHPHPDFPLYSLLGHFSTWQPPPPQPPTYLFSFLDFIFHGEASPPLLPPSWPPPPLSPPMQFLCSFSCLVGNSTSPGVPASPS